MHIEVCQKIFLAIHGIKRDRLQNKVQQPTKSIIDGRGRHNNHRCLDADIVLKVHDFIETLPSRKSHYTRNNNKPKKFLDSHLSINKLYNKFVSEVHPELKTKVSYEKFRQIFNQDFNISFGFPRKDICQVCEKLNMDIKSAEISKDTNKQDTKS
ncbi:unnamed protein product [Diatraea saccharalis]|uniref:Uncharacterized protein n=1 Tax=Diatraea saccharalis TaxID=40085 RepID=A0A9N9R9W3_9NEOP|nr:unnamed protein product [Diatraea saccharalis]